MICARRRPSILIQMLMMVGTFLLLRAAIASPVITAERMAFGDIFQTNKKIEHQLGGVNDMVQDDHGFMWFGCEKGLARYDGLNTRIYRHDDADPFSLPSDFVRELLVDPDGVMWIATTAGLCYQDAPMDRFICGGETDIPWTTNHVRAITVDREGNLYFGAEPGLYRIPADRSPASPVELFVRPGERYTGNVSALALDTQNVLWIGTDQAGVISLNLNTGEQRHYHADSGSDNSLAHNKISTIAIDLNDQVWVGTFGGGLSIMNRDRNRVVNHSYRDSQPGTLSSNVIWDVFPDSQGNVWVAADQGGLALYTENKSFISTRHKPYDPTSLGANQVRDIYEDKNGDLWIGAFPSGISFHNRATRRVRAFRHEPDDPNSLSHSSILDIHKDMQGNIWVGTEDGLNLFVPVKGSFTRYPLQRDSAGTAKAVLAIAQFDEDTLWLGTWSGGLLAFDLNRHTFTAVNTEGADGIGKNAMFIWDILRDSNNDIWFATEFNGMGMYERGTGQFRFITHGRQGRRALPGNFVRNVMEDSKGTIWAATNGGLALLSADAEQPTIVYRKSDDTHGFSSNRPIALMEDRRQRIWVGTDDRDTFVYEPATGRFQHISAEQGLPPGISVGFVEDLQGNIWILTTNGLARVDGDNLTLQMFGPENGLTSNNFNRNAAMREANGHLYIGSADGLNVFDPVELNNVVPEFPVWLTELRVMNQEVKVGTEGSPLNQAITFTPRIALGHRDLMVAFDFAALNYRQARDTRYAYMLEDFDKDWNYIGTARSATYTNIPPGQYTFKVRASKGKDGWTESKDLEVIVRPAPWKTGWAYLFYSLVVLIALYFLGHYIRLLGRTRIYKKLSATDQLTGLANRTGVTEVTKVLFGSAEHQFQPVCLIFADIDHFKRINDTRGHDSGDRILVEVADLFRQCFRKSDLIGRWGGEEFIIICPGMSRENGLRQAEHLRQKIAQHVFESERKPQTVTLSLGVAFTLPGECFESVVKRADEALYNAKNAGRNCIEVAK